MYRFEDGEYRLSPSIIVTRRLGRSDEERTSTDRHSVVQVTLAIVRERYKDPLSERCATTGWWRRMATSLFEGEKAT